MMTSADSGLGHVEGQMLPPQMIMTPDFSVAPPNTYWAMRHSMPPSASTSASTSTNQSQQQQLPTTLDVNLQNLKIPDS